MMWMWISSIVVLLGAELDAGIEHQTARAARRARRRQTGGVDIFLFDGRSAGSQAACGRI